MKNIKEYNYVIYTDGFNEMDEIIFREVSDMDNVAVVSKRTAFQQPLIQRLFKLHFSFRINNVINLPLKRIWFKKLDYLFDNAKPIIYVFNASWFYPGFFKYLKEKHSNCMMAFYFGDTISSKKKAIKDLDIEYLKQQMNYVGSYNPEDVKKYEIKYLPMCYSKIDEYSAFAEDEKYDFVYIGASRDRFDLIKKVYKKIKASNHTYYFYIVDSGNVGYESNDDRFIIADKPLSYSEYISHSLSSKCIIEIVDKESSGGTLRFWDAIMYNKYIITNNREVLRSRFYDKETVIYSQSFDDVDYNNLFSKKKINHNYSGDNSPTRFLLEITQNVI